jgi:hypothetical protein
VKKSISFSTFSFCFVSFLFQANQKKAAALLLSPLLLVFGPSLSIPLSPLRNQRLQNKKVQTKKMEDFDRKRSLDLNAVVPFSKQRRIDEYPLRDELLNFFTLNSTDVPFSRDLFFFLQKSRHMADCNHYRDPLCPWNMCKNCCNSLKYFVVSKYKPSKVCICTFHDEKNRYAPIFLELGSSLNENQFSIFYTSVIESNLVAVAPPHLLHLSPDRDGLFCEVQFDESILKYKSKQNDFWFYFFRFGPLPFLCDKIRVEKNFLRVSVRDSSPKGKYFGFIFKNLEQESPPSSPPHSSSLEPQHPPSPSHRMKKSSSPSSIPTLQQQHHYNNKHSATKTEYPPHSYPTLDPNPYFSHYLQKLNFEQARQLLKSYWQAAQNSSINQNFDSLNPKKRLFPFLSFNSALPSSLSLIHYLFFSSFLFLFNFLFPSPTNIQHQQQQNKLEKKKKKEHSVIHNCFPLMPALQFSDCAAHSREKMHTPASI